MNQQVVRLLVFFVVLVGVLILARVYLLPETFGEKGHYRAAAVSAVVAQPIRYAGREACGLCHGDIAETHRNARHQSVSCEVCHGPGAAHMEDPAENRPAAPRERGYCPLCHGYNPSRPTGFPQIEPAVHNPLKPCISCHDPHEPEPPHVPEGCGACHGEIARTKAVSHHVQLPCTRCHVTPVRHKITPRTVRPEKPRTREFCGGCHAEDATSPREIPRVDLETHGGRYLCWQCHYPHFPELD